MNLTLVLDDEVLRRARVRALQEGTSVNALVRSYLESYAGADQAREALTRLLEISDRSQVFSDADQSWTRDELYQR